MLSETTAKAKQDQVYAFMRDRFADISRIATEGPNGSEFDSKLIKAVFSAVCGDICLRKVQELKERP